MGRPAAGRLPPALEAYIQWHGRALLANEPDTNYLIYSCRGNAYAGMSQRPASLSARSLTRGRTLWPAAMRTSRFRPASLRARAGHCNASNDCSKDSADPPGGWCGGIGDRLRGITTLFYVTGAGLNVRACSRSIQLAPFQHTLMCPNSPYFTMRLR